jgi:uncharacterized protein YjcR
MQECTITNTHAHTTARTSTGNGNGNASGNGSTAHSKGLWSVAADEVHEKLQRERKLKEEVRLDESNYLSVCLFLDHTDRLACFY